MKTHIKPAILTLITTTLLTIPVAVKAAPTTPSRVSSSQLSSFPYRTSGIIWNNNWRGSGTVAAGPKVAVSCAHVVFNNGAWLTNNKWYGAYHSSSAPYNLASATSLRGYWYWTNYSGGTSTTAFSNDFVVHYAYTNLAGGNASGYYWSDSTTSHPLNSTTMSKLIVGYPGADAFYMNSTGAFSSRYTSQYGHYFWNSSVMGGSGMSGGGVFVNVSGDWRLAGVHVSGTTSGALGAGARAMNQAAYNLISSAITSSNTTVPATTTRTFTSTSPLSIPDNSTAWTVRNLSVLSMPASLTAAAISLNITHTYIGDLEVVLASPSGRTLTLHSRAGGSTDNLVIVNRDITSSFSGTNPNGTWALRVRDLAGADVGRLESVSLTLTAR